MARINLSWPLITNNPIISSLCSLLIPRSSYRRQSWETSVNLQVKSRRELPKRRLYIFILRTEMNINHFLSIPNNFHFCKLIYETWNRIDRNRFFYATLICKKQSIFVFSQRIRFLLQSEIATGKVSRFATSSRRERERERRHGRNATFFWTF